MLMNDHNDCRNLAQYSSLCECKKTCKMCTNKDLNQSYWLSSMNLQSRTTVLTAKLWERMEKLTAIVKKPRNVCCEKFYTVLL